MMINDFPNYYEGKRWVSYIKKWILVWVTFKSYKNDGILLYTKLI